MFHLFTAYKMLVYIICLGRSGHSTGPSVVRGYFTHWLYEYMSMYRTDYCKYFENWLQVAKLKTHCNNHCEVVEKIDSLNLVWTFFLNKNVWTDFMELRMHPEYSHVTSNYFIIKLWIYELSSLMFKKYITLITLDPDWSCCHVGGFK